MGHDNGGFGQVGIRDESQRLRQRLYWQIFGCASIVGLTLRKVDVKNAGRRDLSYLALRNSHGWP
jgi:hypothetical protein